MSSQKPDFFEIKEQKMVTKILDVSSRHKILLTVWLKDQALKFETEIKYYMSGSNRLSIALPSGITPDKFREAIKAQGNDEVFASFQLDNIQFFLKTKYTPAQGSSAELIQLEAPKSIFKMQRRTNLRIVYARAEAPKLTALKPGKTYDTSKPISDSDLLSFRVIDISAGGVGIAAPIEQKELLKLDTVLEDVRFKVRGMEIVSRGIVKFAREALNDQGKPMFRIGLQFIGLKAQYEKHIVQYVLDESRKIFSLLH